MNVEVKKLASPYILTFTEEADVVKELVQKSYKKQKGKFIVDGYRKGHAPRKAAEKKYGKFNIYKDVFDELYIRAVNEKELEIIDAQEFSVIGPFEDEHPLTIQAKVYLQPNVEFEIGDLKIKKHVSTITDEDVDKQIELQKKSHAKFVNVVNHDYEVKQGDAMIIDFIGRIDGKEFEGGSANGFRFVIGETKFIEGFEKQIVGMKVGENDCINATFPKDYQNKDLQGKLAFFDVTVKKIEEKIEKNIQELAGTKSIEEYRNDLKQHMIDEAKIKDDETHRANVLNACIKQAEIEPLPNIIVDHSLENEWYQMLERIGKSEEEYTNGNTGIKEAYLSQRRKSVEQFEVSRIFLDFAYKKYGLKIDEKDITAFVEERAPKLGQKVHKILKSMEKGHNRMAVERTVKHEKAVDFLLEKITE